MRRHVNERLSIALAITVCIGSFAVTSLAHARDISSLPENSNQTLDRCLAKADFYSQEQHRCLFAEMNRQVSMTELAFDAAGKRAGITRRRTLAASQRVWGVRTDQKCHTKDFFGPTFLGSIEITDYYYCIILENLYRSEWLDRQYRRPKS